MSYIDDCHEALAAAGKKQDPQIVAKVIRKKLHSYMTRLTTSAIPEIPDLPILAAAYKLKGESIYSTLEDEDKAFCDELIKSTIMVTQLKEIPKPEDSDES